MGVSPNFWMAAAARLLLKRVTLLEQSTVSDREVPLQLIEEVGGGVLYDGHPLVHLLLRLRLQQQRLARRDDLKRAERTTGRWQTIAAALALLAAAAVLRR